MSRGGRRPGAGRKAKDGERDIQSYYVGIPTDLIDQLSGIGDGDISVGVRRVLRQALKPISTAPARGALWKR